MAGRKKRTTNAAAGAGVGAGEAVSPQALEVVRANPDMQGLTSALRPIAPQLVAAVASVVITDTATAAVMADLARQIKTIVGIIDEKFEPLEAGVKQTVKAIRTLKSEIATPFEHALETAKDKLGAWELQVLEAQRVRDRANAAAEAAAQAAEREAARVYAPQLYPNNVFTQLGPVAGQSIYEHFNAPSIDVLRVGAQVAGNSYPYAVPAQPPWNPPQAPVAGAVAVVDANQGARDFGVKLDGVTTVVSWDVVVENERTAIGFLINAGGLEFLSVDVAGLKRAANDKERGPGVRAVLERIAGLRLEEVASVRTRGY